MDNECDEFTPCAQCGENEAVTPQGFCAECNELYFSNSDS